MSTSETLKTPISLGNLSLQPCIDKLSEAVLKDEASLSRFKAAQSLQEQVTILMKTFSHKKNITVREAVFEIVTQLSHYGDSNEGKCEELAEECKVEGSKLFSKHQDSIALQVYTKSLQLCPQSSDNIPLLYANRSAVLFHMQKYEDSLIDIARAQLFGYPDRLRHKLLVRKAQCLQLLGRVTEAKASIHEATTTTGTLEKKQQQTYLATLSSVTKALDNIAIKPSTSTVDDCLSGSEISSNKTKSNSAGTNGEIKNTLPNSNGIGCNENSNNSSLQSLRNTHDAEDYLRMSKKYELLDGPHKTINHMSSALKLSISGREGRHVVTKRAVSSGSTVFLERPFASILLPKYHATYCYACIIPLPTTSVPCATCRVVLYCSEWCRDNSVPWHRLDCCRLTLTSAGGMAQLALRAVMVAGWAVCEDIKKESEAGLATTITDDVFYNDCNPKAKYRALYQLVHHLDKTPYEEQIQYCIASIILASGLQNKLNSLSPGDDDDSFHSPLAEGWGTLEEVAALIYRHIAQLVCNGYAIYQVLSEPSKQPHAKEQASDPRGGVESMRQERLASAIYASASLMNHSCKPTTINSYYGDLLIIRTVENTPAGKQLYSCYGPHYCRQKRSERLSLLDEQYHFTCLCRPCTSPKYLDVEKRWVGFKCEKCGGVAALDEESDTFSCHECDHVSLPTTSFRDACTRAQQLHSDGMSGLASGSLEQSVRDMREAVRLGELVYCLDNECLAAIHDTFAMVLAAAGSYEECARVLRKYLKLVERRYGAKSVESGHEVIKLLRVAQQCRTNSDISSISSIEICSLEERIESIFTVTYGSGWRSIVDV